MYKVMVVDDESIIVQGLVGSLPWAKYDCAVVATASSGKEALPLALQYQPDILFTDINMPEMDGLSLIAALRTQYPMMRITILTGYPVFEYAQRALSMGVSGYLLKPSRFDQLETALATMVDELGKLKIEQEAALAQAQADALKTGEPLPTNENGEPDVEIEDPTLEHTQNFVIQNAIAYMKENYNKKISLFDVAEHVYVSQWHLSKLIARNTNQNFSDILNGIRIDKAKELLKNPALRIWEISDMVGFGDVSHFSRIFKKHVNMSANEYRNKVMLA